MPVEHLSHPDSQIITSYGNNIAVSVQKITQGYWYSDSSILLDDIHPPQQRLDSGFHDPDAEKPVKISYDVPVRHRYWVDTERHHFQFTDPEDGRQKAICWAAIMHDTGIRKMETNRDVVPIEVANSGMAYIAAYMFAVNGYDYSEIVEELDLTKSTLYQYLTDVRKQRR